MKNLIKITLLLICSLLAFTSSLTLHGQTTAELQTEIDDVETGAGLGDDGTYTADSTTNYLTGATSLKDADKKLDAQLNTEASNRATEDTNLGNRTTGETTARTNADNALQADIDKSATQFYIYELPENLEQAMMVKYYYRVDNIPALNASNKTYQIVLMIAIEWMQIDGQNIQLKTIWKGEMVLNLSQRIDWIEALNLGYHKLSQHVLQEGTKKDHINLLNF